MDLQDIQNLWSEYDKKLDRNLELNIKVLRELNVSKAQHNLRNFVLLRIAAALWFVAVAVVLGNFIADNISNIPLVLSAAIIDIFTLLSLHFTVRQIVIATTMDYSAPIVVIQKQILSLKPLILSYARIGALSIPLYPLYFIVGCKIFLDIDIIDILLKHADTWFWIWLILSVAIVIPPALWLYKKTRLENVGHTWVKWFIVDVSWKQIDKAVDFLHTIEQFEKEDSTSSRAVANNE